MDHEHRVGEHEAHSHSLFDELLHHLPYAIFSVATSLILLSLLTYSFPYFQGDYDASDVADALFHNFHFLHIIFAATGTVVTFWRFSHSWWKGVIVGVVTPAVFCTLSDAVLPYYGGKLMGVDMHWHICFYSELQNVLPFLLVGIVNGFVMSRHHYSKLASFSVGSHFVHILVSSVAASMYLLAHGFDDWSVRIGYVFLFLIGAVLLPCTASDVVVPMFFARYKKS